MKAMVGRSLSLRDGDGGNELEVGYTNRGEPYRQGIELHFRSEGLRANVFLEAEEALQLCDLITTLFPKKGGE